MVGDRAHDVEGAAEHGIATVVVGWGYGQVRLRRPDWPQRPRRMSRTVEQLREVLGV